MKETYKYQIYQRDGNNLIELMKVTRKEYEEIREKIKDTKRELILFRWAFIVFKKQDGEHKKLLTEHNYR